MGRELVRKNIGLVYRGGNVGLMGIIADAVLKAGGEMQGVIPEHLMALEIGHKGLRVKPTEPKPRCFGHWPLVKNT
jgi:predicted Rossmann-fold nucleotide-binding protein